MSERHHRRSEAFFGRRKTKALSRRQQGLVDTLLPELRLCLDEPAPASIEGLFAGQPGQIVLEIGFGGGEHLIHQAARHPQTAFIGVEPFVNSLAKCLVGISERELANIRLYDEDATELLDWLPQGCLDRVDLLYPDPWPKKRHWKRRFVSPINLDRIARALRPGGEFRFASDIESYVNWTLNHCERHEGFEWIAESADDWRNPYPDWVRTRYEAKAIREGRQTAYLSFRRV